MARHLGDEEKALWLKVVETIKPLSAPSKTRSPIARSSGKDETEHSEVGNTANKTPTKPEITSSKFTSSSDDLTPTRDDLAAALRQPIKPAHRPKKTPSFRPLSNSDSKRAADSGLDSHWERRFSKGVVIPDISIDLHGAGLQSAYDRLDGALEQARAQRLRVILLITGRQRHYDRASGEGRGGIRAVMSDWLSASRHSDYIASVRQAHPRHGGKGALYIILRK